jgi:hypothetical protein
MIDEMKGVSSIDELAPALRETEERLDTLVMEIRHPRPGDPARCERDDNSIGQQSGEEYSDPWRKPHLRAGRGARHHRLRARHRLSGSRFTC